MKKIYFHYTLWEVTDTHIYEDMRDYFEKYWKASHNV